MSFENHKFEPHNIHKSSCLICGRIKDHPVHTPKLELTGEMLSDDDRELEVTKEMLDDDNRELKITPETRSYEISNWKDFIWGRWIGQI